MKKRRIKRRPIIISLISLNVIICLSLVMVYFINIGSVSKKSQEVTFVVNENETFLSLSDDLKESGLIKSEFFYKLYVKIHKPNNLQKGVYKLNKNQDVKSLINTLNNGTNYNDNITITFKEGKNMRDYIKIITSKTNITETEILTKLKDTSYLDSLITRYWFLNADIKNRNIYYSLEGYLYPDTYELKKDSKIEDIFKTMLDNTEKKLSKYQTSLQNNKYTVHQLLTLSSIVELESVGNDRRGVAGVFYNRLNHKWSLGSDVTTYYGAKINMGDRDLYQNELNASNAYNTRNKNMAGKLPVGPICNPSVLSIEAVLNPTKSNYFYFVADKNKKIYYSKTLAEHNAIIQKLKSEQLWYEY